MEREGRHVASSGIILFLPLGKKVSAREGGEEGSKFLPVYYHSHLAKAETKKSLWLGNTTRELGASVAEVGWGMCANICLSSRVKDLAFRSPLLVSRNFTKLDHSR